MTSTTATAEPGQSMRFSPNSSARVWFLTSATSPVSIAVIRQLLDRGDCVTAGVLPAELHNDGDGSQEFQEFLEDVKRNESYGERLRIIGLNIRVMGNCQAAVAEAVAAYGRIDVLLGCKSEAVVGTIEELSQSTGTLSLMRDQFETNFLGNVNIIKAALPTMRERRTGHIVILTGITGHVGTPGLGAYCASQWAIEGFCDSLAYEVAPFNVRVTIVQPNMEINVLSNKITATPPMSVYSSYANSAPLFREVLGGLLDKLHGEGEEPVSQKLFSPEVSSFFSPLPSSMKDALIAETVHALLAIGGRENPPARHIVGYEGVASVKEKLKTVSEELEDFIEVSCAADIVKEELQDGA